MKRVTSLLAALAITGLVPGCGGDSADGGEIIEVDGFAVVEAWARPSPTGATEAAIYITIENRDAPDDRLIGVSSERCMVMAPHLTTIADDIASMSEAGQDDDVLALETGGRVVMEPNGLHAMCLGLTDLLKPGDEFDVVLQFRAHDPIAALVTVRQR